MIDEYSLIESLFGKKRSESRPCESDTSTITGIATSDSESGSVCVYIDGDLTGGEDGEFVIPTEARILEGDIVSISLVGGTAKSPRVTGTVGGGDRIYAEIVEAEELIAGKASIDDLEAATARIVDMEADTAKIHNLTANELSAATGYIGDLTTGNVTAANIISDHGDFATVKANSAKVANLTAAQLEADHATVGSLGTTYAQIDLANVANGAIGTALIADAAITNEKVSSVSANKLTAGTIDAGEINVVNMRAENLVVKNVNGQTVIGGYALVDKSQSGYSSKNPKTEGWYELSNGNYVLTNDTTVNANKNYYASSTSATLYDTNAVDGLMEDLNDRIDGTIESFTGTVEPTLSNAPASSWTTTALKDEHVGDIYYVVNSSGDKDGYCYRFAKSGSGSSATYSWVLIKDSDVTAALAYFGDMSTLSGDFTVASFATSTAAEISNTQSSVSVLRSDIGEHSNYTTNTVAQQLTENSSRITSLTETVEYGGRNLLDNSALVTLGKAPYSNSTATNYTTSYGGVLALYCSGSKWVRVDFPTLVSGDKYTLSFDATRSNAQKVYITIGSTTTELGSTSATSGEWKRFSHTFTAGSDTYARIRVYSASDTGGATYVASFKNFKLECGERATPWDYSQADKTTLTNTVNTVSQTATSNSSVISQLISTLGTNSDGSTKAGDIVHRMSTAESSITQNANNIALKVSESDVTGNYLVGKINLDATTATIAASKVNIAGAAIFQSGGYLNQDSLDAAYDAAGSAAAVEAQIPTAVSDLTNDSGFITSSDVPTDISDLNDDIGIALSSDIPTNVSDLTNDTGFITSASLPTKVSDLTNDSNFATQSEAQGYATTAANSANSQEQLIYCSKASGTSSLSSTTTWITDTTGGQNKWTLKRPQYSSSYPVLFVATQRKTVGGTVTCTTPMIDDTTTVIDGGNIITGTVTANKLDAANINASNSLTVGALDLTDSTTSSAIANSVLAQGVYYATCTTAAATAIKAATTTLGSFTLTEGVMVNVKFSNTNSAAVADLKLDVNGTGEKPIKYIYNASLSDLPGKGYLLANNVYTFRYDGTNWVVQLMYNTNSYDRRQHNNAVKAAENITRYAVCGGTEGGYKKLAAGLAFDLSYPILYLNANTISGQSYALASGSTSTNFYEAMLSVTFTYTASIEGGAANKMLYLKGTVSGNTFTVASSNFLTTVVPSTADGFAYMPLGVMTSATVGYFTSPKDIYAYKDGAFGPVSIREAAEAAKTATNYITEIDSNGIKVHAVNNISTNYAQINANGMEVYKDGTSVAQFSDNVRIGQENGLHQIGTPTAISFYDEQDVVAYISTDKFFSVNSEVEDAFYIGNYSLRNASDGKFVIGLRR